MTLGTIVVWVVVGILVWFFLGCLVLGVIDRDEKILKWAKSCPLPGGINFVIMLWPLVVWVWFKEIRPKELT